MSEPDASRLTDQVVAGMVEGFGDAVFIVDALGLIRYANHVAGDICGCPPDDLIGTPYSGLVDPEHKSAVVDALSELPGRRGQTARMEHRLRRKDGGWEYVETTATCHTGSGHEVRLMLCIRRVKELQRAELQASQLEQAIEQAHDGIAIIEFSGIFRYANSAWALMHGYTKADIIGLTIARCHTVEQYQTQVEPAMRQLQAQGFFEGEIEHLRSDGQVFPTSMTATLLRDASGQATAMLAVARDITEARAVAAALEESTARLDFALQHSHTGTWDFDLVNHSVQRSLEHDLIFGYETLQPAWTYETFLEHILPEDRAEADRLVQAAIASRTELSFECRIRRQDGTVRWISVEGGLRLDAAGQPYRLLGILQDISRRKEVEEALRLSERRHRELFLNAREAMFVIQDGQLVYFNPEVTGILGYTSEEIGSLPFTAFIHPDDREMVVNNYIRRLRGEQVLNNYQFRVIQADGGVRWIELNATLIEWDNWPATLNFTSDVTEKREAEQQLLELAEAVEQAADGIAITDLLGVHRYLNHAYAKILGCEKDELVGKRLRDVVDDEQLQAKYEQFMATVLAGGFVSGEIKRLSLEGTEQFISASATLLRDAQGQPTGIIGVVRDITEAKATQSALAASAERLNYLVDVSPAIIYTSKPDQDFTVTFMSAKVGDVLGYRPEAFTSDATFWANHVHPEDREKAIEKLSAVMTLGKAGCEYRFQCANGAYVWFHDQRVLTHDERGNPAELIGAWLDISERKRAAELEVEKRAAEEASRAKSTFLATMSHEIRTPMNGVIGTVDVLRRMAMQPEQADLVDLIADSAQALMTIINDILDFSKIEAGKLDLDLQPVAVGELAESICGTQNAIAREKAVELSCYVDPTLPDWIVSDAVRLRQILSNLTSNAIKFSAGHTAAPRVSVRVERADGPCLRFCVIDNGVGMAPEVVQRLFTPFTQADGTITRKYGGTGLGLTICKSLTEMLHGSVTVESTAGLGSTFTVILPLLVPETSPPAPERPDLSGLTCAVVSDHAQLASDWQSYLVGAGAQVYLVSSTAAAAQHLAASASDKAAVAVLDTRCIKPELAGLRAVFSACHSPVRFVLASRGSIHRIKHIADDAIGLECDILRRDRFLQAVALAAGLIKPLPQEHFAAAPAQAVAPTREEALAQGRLILFAEDNEINQKVISLQLSSMGFACETAGDGAQALELWRSRQYALLISDLHMPVMDGYALAEAIRKEEQAGEHIPIIAFTANISRGERDQCMAAGMDAFLTKPAQTEMLHKVLDHWLPAPQHGTGNARVPSRAAGRGSLPEAPAVLEVSILEHLVGSEPAVIEEFLLDYMGSMSDACEQIRLAYADGDYKTVATFAHKLKSSSRCVGAMALGDCCERLETAGRAGDCSAVITVMAEFEQYAADTLNAIITYRSR